MVVTCGSGVVSVGDMGMTQDGAVIGYSIFETGEECWQYNENACFIGNSHAAAQVFLAGGWTPASECRIEPVTFADLLRDFGYSGGEYAMEREAFLRFQQLAGHHGVRFEAEPYDGDDSLLVVTIDGVTYRDDE